MKKIKIHYQIQEWYNQWSQWNDLDAPNPDRKTSIENFRDTVSKNPDMRYRLIKVATTEILAAGGVE